VRCLRFEGGFGSGFSQGVLRFVLAIGDSGMSIAGRCSVHATGCARADVAR
jgi:hypothetical protein